jgi:hypothetical protein
MSDRPPLFFEKRLGGLFPVSPDATAAVAALPDKGRVRVEMKRTNGNSRRIALYWITLGIAAPMLSERCEGEALDAQQLHLILKHKRGLVKETVLPSGEVHRNYDSISFASMAEDERTAFVTWSFETLAKWLGVSVSELTHESERQAA